MLHVKCTLRLLLQYFITIFQLRYYRSKACFCICWPPLDNFLGFVHILLSNTFSKCSWIWRRAALKINHYIIIMPYLHTQIISKWIKRHTHCFSFSRVVKSSQSILNLMLYYVQVLYHKYAFINNTLILIQFC
jgi:hypothetical protein